MGRKHKMNLIYYLIFIGLLLAIRYIFIFFKAIVEYILSKKYNKEKTFKEIYNKIERKHAEPNDIKKKKFYILLKLWAITSVIILILPYTSFGSKTVGSLVAQKKFKEYYYGELTKEYNSSEKSNVIVLIEVDDGLVSPKYIYYSEDNFFKVEEFSDFIFWYKSESEVIFDGCSVMDRNGDFYDLQLYDTKVNKDQIYNIKKPIIK